MKMTLKKTAAVTFALIAGAAFCADFAPVKNEVKKVHVYQPEHYAVRQGAILSNQLCKYEFFLVQSKSNGTNAPRTQLWLQAGQFGFSPLVGFFKLKVNGIELDKLPVNAEDLQPWAEGKNAGAELKLNYDGAKFVLRMYLRPDSPVLWCSLIPAKDSVEPVQTISAEITAIPSQLLKKNNQVVWNGGYNRMAVTPARTIEQNPERIALTPQDTMITLQDKDSDGSAAEKGQGPCWVSLNYDAVAKAVLRVNDDWTSSIYLTLKPDMKEFQFGFWQQVPRISNADFAKKLSAEKAAFTR